MAENTRKVRFAQEQTSQNTQVTFEIQSILLDFKCVSLRFNSTGTLLQSVGDDNKLFLIDVRLSASHQSASLANFANQRLQSDYNSKATSFQPGFYVLGFLGTLN